MKATLHSVDLLEVAELISDPEVEDIVVIPGRPVYVTKKWGKHKTDVVATQRTIRAILKLARLKGIELTMSRPSLRFGLRFGGMRMRISLDLPPIVPYPQAYIRIHRKKITLKEMLKEGFLTKDQLSTLLSAVRSGLHVVVAGAPGSGKTSLLVALDDLIPPNLQRVYIDEADEFEEDPQKNQIKIASVDKVREVYASLNRNIDVVFIGELQYPDHFEAYKISTEIGLQTFATLHAVSVEDALKRLGKYTEVKNTAIVLLSKKYYKDKIERKISEIHVK
ncbi:MAG: ATPase, T2SS/T4P/T4SS family [Pyrobaculum sp.]